MGDSAREVGFQPAQHQRAAAGTDDGQPAQCGESGGYRSVQVTGHDVRPDEDGVWVHEQEPVHWEECEVRFESRLLFPDGEHPPTTYLQLSIENCG